MNAIKAGTVRGMNHRRHPAMSDPDANHARESLAELEHLVVQDIFFTETAYLADVILPASAFPEKTGTFTNTDRLVQMGRQASIRPATRPGGRRPLYSLQIDTDTGSTLTITTQITGGDFSSTVSKLGTGDLILHEHDRHRQRLLRHDKH